MSWQNYPLPNPAFAIPPARFGKDHWSVLLYLETCAVERKGCVENLQMRCAAKLHPAFAHTFSAATTTTYPTFLKDGEQANHDDWSCLEDLATAGFLTAYWQRLNDWPLGGGEMRVVLTERGWCISHALRRHRAGGGSFRDFSPSAAPSLADAVRQAQTHSCPSESGVCACLFTFACETCGIALTETGAALLSGMHFVQCSQCLTHNP